MMVLCGNGVEHPEKIAMPALWCGHSTLRFFS
jgi:hypothetical protein